MTLNEIFILVIILMLAYFIGSLSSAIIVCQLAKLPDPRTEGSKNPGATNVLRLAGKKWAIWVFIGDFLKGVVAVLLAKYFLGHSLWLWVGLVTVVGHIYPIFFRFAGGKGVATAAGVLLVGYWPLGSLVIATWIAVLVLTRYSSLAALVATLSALFYRMFFFTNVAILPLIILCLLILWRHRSNIQRLCMGQETKIGRRN